MGDFTVQHWIRRRSNCNSSSNEKPQSKGKCNLSISTVHCLTFHQCDVYLFVMCYYILRFAIEPPKIGGPYTWKETFLLLFLFEMNRVLSSNNSNVALGSYKRLGNWQACARETKTVILCWWHVDMIIQHHRTAVFMQITVIIAPKNRIFSPLEIFIFDKKYKCNYIPFFFLVFTNSSIVTKSLLLFLSSSLSSSPFSCKCRFISLIQMWHVFSQRL